MSQKPEDLSKFGQLDVYNALITLELVGRSSSILDKKELLGSDNNPALKLILKLTYNPFKVYYIKETPDVCNQQLDKNNSKLVENLKSLLSLLDQLSSRSLSGNLALAAIDNLFHQMCEEEVDLYRRVIKKDLNLGIKAKTINAVFPGLIPEFGVQLAKDFSGKLPRKILIQPKLDGYRAIGQTGTGRLFSRNGKEILGFDDISEQLSRLPSGCYLDGEIMSQNFKGTQQSAFAHTSGKLGIYNAFDFMEGSIGTKEDQHTRSKNLLEFLGVGPEGPRNVRSEICNIIPVQSWLIDKGSEGSVYDEMLSYYDQCLAEGYEGIMIKDAEAPYQLKRGTNWQKMKPVNSIDLKVVGIEPGKYDTKYADSLGRLIVQFEDNQVGVGSGITDAQRQLWWDNPTLIVGKTIEVLYQEVTSNQKGGKSLRFPRFKCIRTDK